MDQIIIFGSSRSHGNTRKAVNAIMGKSGLDFVDLNTLKISPYDYEHSNQSDDFIPLIERLVAYESSREPLYRDSLSHHRTSDVAYGGFAVMFTKS